MTTLAVMKARIADEIARSDLTSQIAYAITDAIEAYKQKKFSFSNARFNFSTVISQEFYDSSDHANLAADVLQKIESIFVYIGETPRRLKAMSPDAIESAATDSFTADPSNYCWYGEQLRLWPIPYAVRTVRMLAKIRPAAPAADGTTGNAWMTEGERLIRCRAKFELFTHVIRNSEKAAEMVPLINEAFDQLREKDTDINIDGPDGTVEPMRF
jgi:hypothetical protein